MPDQIHSKHALVIDEPNHLNALLKAIWTLKFSTPIEDSEMYAGSPYIADIVNRANDSLIAIYVESGNLERARSLASWRKLENKTVEPRLLATLVDRYRPQWDTWTQVQRYDFVRIVLAPIIVTDEEIAAIMFDLEN